VHLDAAPGSHADAGSIPAASTTNSLLLQRFFLRFRAPRPVRAPRRAQHLQKSPVGHARVAPGRAHIRVAEERLEGALGDAARGRIGREGVLGAGVEAHLHADLVAGLDPGAPQARPGPAAARPDPAAAPGHGKERLRAEASLAFDVLRDPLLKHLRHGESLHLAGLRRADRRVQTVALARLAHREPAVVVVGHVQGHGLTRPQAHQRHGQVDPATVLGDRVEDLVLRARRERCGRPLRRLRPGVLAR